MRNVTIVGQSFPVTEDTDAADHPSWCDAYTTALQQAFAANPSSAFPVPTAANEGQVLQTKAGLPVWSNALEQHALGGTYTGPVVVGKGIVVAFPRAFAATPAVTLTVGPGPVSKMYAVLMSVDANGFACTVVDTSNNTFADGRTVTVQWTAIGK